MPEEQKAREEEVFDQELSVDDLDAAAGGTYDCGGVEASMDDEAAGRGQDANTFDCVQLHKRLIYAGSGFPNCAATVEDGSWCDRNDACYGKAIDYQGMAHCKKAWD